MDLITPHRAALADLCRRHRVRRLVLFGSVARRDFVAQVSYLDFLVEFDDDGCEGSSDRYFGVLFGLEDLFHRKIDLVELAAVRNPWFLDVARRHRKLIYD